MTNEEHRRLTEALTKKARLLCPGWPPAGSEDEWLQSVIGMAVADTTLVLEGVTTIEQYE